MRAQDYGTGAKTNLDNIKRQSKARRTGDKKKKRGAWRRKGDWTGTPESEAFYVYALELIGEIVTVERPLTRHERKLFIDGDDPDARATETGRLIRVGKVESTGSVWIVLDSNKAHRYSGPEFILTAEAQEPAMKRVA